MESDKFWSIISTAKSNSSGELEKHVSEIEKELLKLNKIEIVEFDNTFRKFRGEIYNWDFWAAAYIINGGCSDDCFSDFRGWLIFQGQNVFESAINDIESISKFKDISDGDWEAFSYLIYDTYYKKTGLDMPEGIVENYEISGDEWSEDGDDLEKKYPKLWDKYTTNL